MRATTANDPAAHSIPAEESVIGGILVHGSKIADARPLLRPADFFHPALRAIYEAMLELDAQAKPIDAVTVAERMHSVGTFDNLRAFNGSDYLVDLMAKVVTVENIGHHARIVREKATQRETDKIVRDYLDRRERGEAFDLLAERVRRQFDRLSVVDEPAAQPAVTCAANIPVERVKWLWRGRIALGMVNLLDGDPGLGKSTITNDLAARTTNGDPLPGEADRTDPAGVVFVSFEEHPGAVMVPRLVAAGADLKRVFIWDLATHGFNLRDSLDELRTVIRNCGARLVVIDPLMAALPGELNAHRDQDIRSVMAGVSSLAEDTGAAILFVRHLNKNSGGSALYRGGGSIGIIGAARCGLLLARDPDAADGEDDGSRVLAVTKCNVARPAPALRMRLVSAASPAPGVEVARIVWGDTCSDSADALVEPQEERTEIGRALELLRNVMKDGPVLATEAQAALDANGISKRTEARAKQRLGIVAKREGVKGKWWWYTADQLPPSHAANQEAQ